SLVLLTLALAGCTGGGTGSAGIMVTDKPTEDYSSVLVTFSRAAIHQAGSDEGNASENSTAGWITVVNASRTVDLLALHANQTAEALGFAQVAAGRYTQVRVYVDRVEAMPKNGTTAVEITVPSGVLRTAKSFEVRAGGNTTLTLEIDLDRSISCNANRCLFQPVLGKVEAQEQ
ncbi:MAG TPA: DUF4382 domain-containing protein, partial [Candidatus Thermoplasmatota archaeon]|nr:DUF4382 domain-containing protein [Candidatus Thermoplasmatota archaeon]